SASLLMRSVLEPQTFPLLDGSEEVKVDAGSRGAGHARGAEGSGRAVSALLRTRRRKANRPTPIASMVPMMPAKIRRGWMAKPPPAPGVGEGCHGVMGTGFDVGGAGGVQGWEKNVGGPCVARITGGS